MIAQGYVLSPTASVLCLLVSLGCGDVGQVTTAPQVVKSTWHEKCGWKSEDYFQDPKVIALCEAIEANDLTEIDRLVAAGADVNAIGKGKMAPLLWAYPDNQLSRFKRLLEHGADPNVVIESDFNTRGAMSPGISVTHLACKTSFPGYFEAVFAHGGDPNLILTGRGHITDSPLHMVIQYGGEDKATNIETLLEMGAEINYVNGAGATPVRLAIGWGGQYDIALMLLEAGADWRIYRPRSNSRIIHLVATEERRRDAWSSEQKRDYNALVGWLEARGESLSEARAEIERWQSWNIASGEYRRNMDAEIAARKAQEAAGKAPVQDNDAIE